MPNARTRTTATPTVTPEQERAELLARIVAVAVTLDNQASIGHLLGCNDKTGRGRSRAGTLKHDDGKPVASFNPVREKLSTKPPTRTAEGWVYTYAPADIDALRKLADEVAPV